MSLFGSSQPDEAFNKQTRAESAAVPPLISSFHTPTNKNMPATVIAKGVKLEGEFKSQGDVLIEGEVIGNIQTEGLLTVGPEAVLKAGISAGDAVIAGKIEGNINVKKRLELKATAKIKGDISCQTAVVESGAAMQGNVKCGEESKPVAESNKSVTSNG
ncbi:MAG: polymer-forming cytoskeletal protein [Patescibacteria group bacterium]|jgi:cytoskeletal protein CcmA (bactofilin family)